MRLYKNDSIYAKEFKELIVPDNLIAWWPLYENEKEIAGSKTTSTKTAGITFDNAVIFDGSNSIRTVTTSTDVLNRAKNFTISAWVFNPDITQSSYVISKCNGSGFYDQQFALYISNGISYNYIYPCIAQSSIAVEFNDLTKIDNVWFLYTVTYDGVTVKVYINDELVHTEARTVNALFKSQLWFGARYSENAYFTGKVRDVRYFDKALSDAEVSNLYRIDTVEV